MISTTASTRMDYLSNGLIYPTNLFSFNLDEVIEKVIGLFNAAIREKIILLENNIQNKNLTLYNDKLVVELIIANLFRRSLSRLPKEGIFQVDATRYGEQIEISFLDNGYFIEEDIDEEPPEVCLKWESFLFLKESLLEKMIFEIDGKVKLKQLSTGTNQMMLFLPIEVTPEKPNYPDNVISLFG